MIDNYSHSDPNIIYITESILGPVDNNPEYEILFENYNSQILGHCLCGKTCIQMLCNCLNISHGDNYERHIYDGVLMHRLKYKFSVNKQYPIIECNSNCNCPSGCGNRVVQNGPMEGLIVKLCDLQQKGLGLFTPHFIHKGTFICEYAGELLTKTQALRRSEDNDAQGKMNYIFCLNEHTIDGVIQTFVDPCKFGNIGRYINHSCEPNCTIVPVRSEIAIPHLAIFASTDIGPGTELTFSYGLNIETSQDDHEIVGKRKKCHCNAHSCCGFMPSEKF